MSVFDVDQGLPRSSWPDRWQLVKTSGALTLESRYLAKDGRRFPVELSLTHQVFEGEEYLFAVARDISERKRAKAELESAAMERIRASLPEPVGEEVVALWREFEARQTPEARFAGALDHLEVQIQHNLADLATWEEVEYDLVYTKMDAACAHDPFLAGFCAAVKDQAEAKMRDGGVDVDAVKMRVMR